MKALVRVVAGLGASALLVGALAGCTAANPNLSSTDSGTSSWSQPTASLKGVSLKLWTQPATNTYADQVIKAFETATGATISKVVLPDQQTQQTQLATGDIPDIAWWQPTESAMSPLQPTTKLQPLDGAPWLNKLNPQLQKIGMVGGKHYAAVVSFPSVLGVFYNKAAFAKAGITQNPSGWDEFVADAKKIKAAGVVPFEGAVGDRWPTQWWPQVQLAEDAKAGFWTKVNTHQATFSSPPMLKAITEYDSLINQGLFNPDIKTAKFDDQGTSLLAGNAAMVIQDSSAFIGLLQSKTSVSDINAKIGWFPISSRGNIATTIPTGANALVAFKTGDSEKEAAVRQFLRFWMETDYKSYLADQKILSVETGVPNPAGLPELLPIIQASLTNSVGSMQSSAIANPDLYIYLADMVNGALTPSQVAAKTQDQFTQLAHVAGVKGF